MTADVRWAEFEKRESRAKQIAKLINEFGALLGLDWVFGTKFTRDFSNAPTKLQNKPYLMPMEVIDHDEDEIIERLREIFAADTTQEIAKGAARDGVMLNSDFVDPHWGHTTGNLYGRLTIDEASLDAALHDDLRVGLFKNGATYEAYCRPNYLYDEATPIAINRMSLKLKMPELVPNAYREDGAHELDLLMSEGVAPDNVDEPDGQGFFFRDARQLLMASATKDSKFDAIRVLLDSQDAQTLFDWKAKIFTNATDKLRRGAQTRLTWDQKHYFSAGPYALGPGAMKFALRPETSSPGEPIDIWQQPFKRHHEAFRNVAANDREVKFTLMVQVATADALPTPQADDPEKCVMAAEYTDLAWNTDVAPFKDVGTLTLRPHMVHAADPTTQWHALPFSAWNTYNETRPLGQLFRARRHVHRQHHHARLTHSFEVEAPFPEPTKCPFRA